MKKLIPVMVLVVIFLTSSYPREVYIDNRTNTGIYLNVQEKVFPKHWYDKNISASAEPLAAGERGRMIRVMNLAFAKYPDRVIRENLTSVYLFKSMKFYGVPYGGTNFRNYIYLASDETNPNFTDAFVEGVFHHEFSSILMRNYAAYFDRNGWMKINPEGFRYGNGGTAAIINGEASLAFDYLLNEQGFLTRYSQSSLEEDANVFAQHLFDDNWEFWSIVEVNEKVRQKATLLINFYHSIDPEFTEEYFRNFYRRTAAR
jgi:hypothetical protein